MSDDLKEQKKLDEDLAPNVQDTSQFSAKDLQSFTNATGMALARELTKWISIGTFMGVSDAIPGYSGGTTLALVGAYDRLLLTARNVIKPEPGISRWKAFVWMLPFALGWILGVFGFAKFTEFMVQHNFGLELMFLFSFFIMVTIPTFVRGEKPHIFRSKNVPVSLRRGMNVRRMLVVVGFLIVIALAIIAYFRGGVQWSEHPAISVVRDTKYHLTIDSALSLMSVSFLAGATTIIPGASGAIIQLLFGKYKDIHWIIMAHIQHNVLPMLLFTLSNLAGMIVAIFVLSWFLKHRRSYLSSLSFGMLLASIVSIYLVPETSIWHNISEVKHILGIIGSIILASVAGLVIHIRTTRKFKRRTA